MDRWQDHFTRDQLVSQIRVLAERGRTVSEVAEAIGHALTRNQVAGFARRAHPKILFGQKRQKEKERLKFSILSEGPTINSAMSYDEMRSGDGRCRFPLWPHRIGNKAGTPDSFERMFCGATALDGKSWCLAHDELVHERS